jgi:hypothetical protein
MAKVNLSVNGAAAHETADHDGILALLPPSPLAMN